VRARPGEVKGEEREEGASDKSRYLYETMTLRHGPTGAYRCMGWEVRIDRRW